MLQPIPIAVIGDYNPQSRYHLATNTALEHAAQALGRVVEISWIPTPALEGAGAAGNLAPFAGIWCSPGSPYVSMQGALNGIRFARERGKPFVGT